MQKLIKAIREKHVGTAAEHDLLRRLEQDAYDIEAEIEKRVEESWEARMDALAKREALHNAIDNSAMIDSAVYQWLQTPPNDSDWPQSNVAYAMAGRGLTAAHLRTIADRMEQIKK